MQIVAIDYGKKRVGVAVSEGIFAQKLTTIHKNEIIMWLGHYIKKHDVSKIILGMPQGYLANEVNTFGNTLGHTFKLPVIYQDETLSSYKGQKDLVQFGSSKKARKDDDAHAAVVILQSYLDEHEK